MKFTHLIGRKPYLIGPEDDPQVKRWWLLPRNNFLNIYVHNILRSDDDRARHTHPWSWNVSIMLRGTYREWLTDTEWREHTAPAVIFRRGASPHRLELPIVGTSVWTLFITGRVVRIWGFLCPRGFVPYPEFLAQYEGGNVRGKGCE